MNGKDLNLTAEELFMLKMALLDFDPVRKAQKACERGMEWAKQMGMGSIGDTLSAAMATAKVMDGAMKDAVIIEHLILKIEKIYGNDVYKSMLEKRFNR